MNSCDTCIQFKIDGAQNFSGMCMCIEFVIQVPKQKNAHVSFPVGMVSASPCLQTLVVKSKFEIVFEMVQGQKSNTNLFSSNILGIPLCRRNL